MLNLFGTQEGIHIDEESLSGNEVNGKLSFFTRLLNCVRLCHIPAINFIIIGILGSFLAKLTTKYTELYMKNSLITIIVTNLVLYGISESLAQSILCFRPNQPAISVQIKDYVNDRDTFNSDMVANNQSGFPPYSDNVTDNESIDSEMMDRFLDYIRDNDSNVDLPIMPAPTPNNVYPFVDLSYFNFSRLAGFMCWGFLMAFAQCLWYKFLQIYSTDPKFIEVLRKVLTDQLCYSPISLACFFTYGTIIIENGSWEETKAKLSKIYLKTLLINYSVWFPVQFFNFLVIPRNYQVPFSSSISVLWNCFLSMRNSSN